MAEIKRKSNGARQGAGRKNQNKTATMLGYKCTPEEANEMKKSLAKIKEKTNKTPVIFYTIF